MVKSLDATYLDKLDDTENKPILLYEFYLDSGTLRLCDYKSDVVFPTAGNTYTAIAVSHERVSQAGGDQLDSVTITCDNVGQLLGAYVVNEHFRGRAVIIRRVFADALGSANYAEIIFAGELQEPTVDWHTITVGAKAGTVLRRREPLKNYQRTCRHTFGNDLCNTDGDTDITTAPWKVSSTATAGTTTTVVDTVSGDLSGSDNYYNNGRITAQKTIGGSERIETRRVIDYDQASKTITVEIPFSWTIDVNTTYVLIAGCKKTWNDCRDKWGNLMNFGGFIHV